MTSTAALYGPHVDTADTSGGVTHTSNTHNPDIHEWCRDQISNARKVGYENGRRQQAELTKICLEFRPYIKNPPGIVGEGYLYVIEFTTGTVKVGQTEDPRQRLNSHFSDAAAFGVGINAYWISPSHRNFKENEALLIEACRKVSTRSRREYFHEIGYDAAVDIALGLDFHTQITNPVCCEMDRR